MHIKTQKHLENLAKCLKINPTVAKEIIKVKDESENILKMIEQNGFIKEIGQKVEAMEGESRAALLGGKRKQSFQKKKKSSSFIKADKRVRSLYDSSESEYIPDKEEVYKKFSLPVKTENETLEIVKPSINLNLFEIGLRLTNEEIEEDVMMIQDAIETYEMFLVKNTIIVKNTRTLN